MAGFQTAVSGGVRVMAVAMVFAACTSESAIEPTPIEKPVETDWRYPHGFVWTREAGFKLLPAVPGAGVFPSTINNRGEVAGTVCGDFMAYRGSICYFQVGHRGRAFIWSGGSSLTYLDPSASWAMTEAAALNDAGFIAGRFARREGNSHGPIGLFLWHRDSGMLTAQSPSSTWADPVDLDNSGQIIGNFYSVDTRGFRWRLRPDGASGPELLSRSSEYPNAFVVDANDVGQVLGYDAVSDAYDPVFRAKPSLWNSTGDRVDLFPECSRDCAMALRAINNDGYIAGSRTGQVFRRSPSGAIVTKAMSGNVDVVAMNSGGDIVGTVSANGITTSWLWMATGDLVDIGKPAGATMVYARGINDKGQVIGVAK